MDGALEVCRALARIYRLYVVTNGVTRVQRRRLRNRGWRRAMSGVFVSEQMGVQKPKRAFFRAGRRANRRLFRIAHADHRRLPHLRHGGRARLRAGHLLVQPERTAAAHAAPTFEIHSLRELLPLLAGGTGLNAHNKPGSESCITAFRPGCFFVSVEEPDPGVQIAGERDPEEIRDLQHGGRFVCPAELQRHGQNEQPQRD